MKTLCFCLSPKEDALAPSEAARFARLCQKLTALGVAFALLRNEEDYPPAAKKLIEERGEDLLPLALFDGAPAAVGRIPTSEELELFLGLAPGALFDPQIPKKKVLKGFGCSLRSELT